MELDETEMRGGAPGTVEELDGPDDLDAKFGVANAGGAAGFETRHHRDRAIAELFGEPVAPIKIGRFTIVRQLGAGGMGVVYVAYDEQLDRRVAVKLLHGARPSVEARARLEREAQAMARLSHPNVVTVHEVGRFEDQIYVAMEFVDGLDLREWMSAETRDWREVVEVFVQAGSGLAAAHEAGLVHRDFKPDNVLVGHDGRVRVADFGLAHAFEASHATADSGADALEVHEFHETEPPATSSEDSQGRLGVALTRTGAVMGTPAYMSPEQYAGRRTDARSDQFSFCVALWEALYGQRPFGGGSLIELSAAVIGGELRQPPDEGNIPTWLRAAITRGLASKPAERWPSMSALLAAIDLAPRARRGRRLLATGLGAAALAVIASLGWTSASELRHNVRQRYWNGLTAQLLEIERERGLRQAQDDARQARDATRMSVLRSYKPTLGVAEHEDPTVAVALLRELEGTARHGPEWISTANELLGRPLSHAVLTDHHAPVTCLSYGPDGSLYSGSMDGEVRRWAPARGTSELLVRHEGQVIALALDAAGDRLASCSEDGSVRLWSAATGEDRELARHELAVLDVTLTADGRWLASASQDGRVELHDLRAGTSARLGESSGAFGVVRFDERGERLLAGASDGSVWVWTVADARLLGHEPAHTADVFMAHATPGEGWVTAADDGSVRRWTVRGDQLASTVLTTHEQAVTALAVHGDLLASADLDGNIALGSLSSTAAVELDRHAGGVWSLAFTPDGAQLASASFDTTARLTRVDGRVAPLEFLGHRLALSRLAVDPSGRWLATGSYDSSIRIWDLHRQPLSIPLRGHDTKVFSLAVDPTGARALTASEGLAQLWDVRDGARLARLELGPSTPNDAAFGPRGERIAVALNSGEIEVWELETGERRVLRGHEGPVWQLAFDATGDHLASGSFDATARIWDLRASDAAPVVLRGHTSLVSAIEFGPDGRRVLTGSHDGSVRTWDAASGDSLSLTRIGSSHVGALARSPDGRTIAAASGDGSVWIWSVDAPERARVIDEHTTEVHALVFDADGRRLATGAADGLACVWDTASGERIASLLGHASTIWGASFVGADELLTVSSDNTARLWTIDGQRPPIVLYGHDAQVLRVAVIGRDRAITTANDGSARLWRLDQLLRDPAVIDEALERATTYCVPIEQRMRELGEDTATAELAYARCRER